MTQSLRLPHQVRTLLLCAGFALPALLGASRAMAEPATPIRIPAGSLESALLAVSAQTHQQVLFPRDLVAGKTAPALAGAYSAEEAIRKLAPADITVTRAGPSVLVLRQASAPRSRARPEVAAGRPFNADAAPIVTAGAGPAAGAPPDLANTVAAVEVTGTHIRGAPPASPLVVVTRADLERTGRATIAEALQTLPQNFGGVASEGNTLTGADSIGRNTGFGTALNLRGLGNGATLVLVNGRRVAGSGQFGDFADISTIPTAAVERVEVLLDGASAIYGSDAVGGVVNIIMRRNFDGAETRVMAGVATVGGPGQEQVSQTLGRRWESGGVIVAYELQHRDALPDADRRFAATEDLRPYGGADFRLTTSFPGNILAAGPTGALIPGFAIPAGQTGVGLLPSQLKPGAVNLQNQRHGEDLLPRQTMNSVYLAADQALGERLQLSADGRYSDRRFSANGQPATSTFTVSRANPFFVAPNGATSETIGYSFSGDLPNPVVSGSVKALALSAGATLRLPGDWRTEGYLTFAQEVQDNATVNVVNSLALSEALGTIADRPDTSFSAARDGFFNPFSGIAGSNPAAVTNFIGSGVSTVHSRDRVASASLQADGTVWRLPGGPLKLAVGLQARRETLVRSGFNRLSTVTPVALSGTDVGRNVGAVFAEARIPVFGPDNARPGLQRLEVSLSGRIERYQAIGSTSNPMIGVLWTPTADLQVRGTYATSFRAPALRELNDAGIYSPLLLTAPGGGRVRTLELSGGNPDLRPETARSWTGGIEYKPARWPGLVVSATGFDVTFKNRIDRPALTSLATSLTDPTLSSFRQFISPSTSASDLVLIKGLLASPVLSTALGVFQPTDYGAIIDGRYVNTTTLHVRGLDVNGRYGFNLASGRMSLGGDATYLFLYDQQLTPTSVTVDKVNLANFPVRFRSRITADWTKGHLSAGAAVHYVGGYHDLLGSKIAAQPTVDLQLRIAAPEHGVLRGVTTLLSVRNVFDRPPPFYNNPNGFAYDPANADPIGRFVSIQLTRTW